MLSLYVVFLYSVYMLKPLNKSTVTKPKKSPSQIVVSMVNGKQIYSNADTGEIVDMSHNRYTPAYEVFNSEKASIVISSLAQGRALPLALEDACITKATFSSWIMKSDEFSLAIDKARETRAQFTHEKFYSVAHDELTSDIPDDEEDLKIHAKKLQIIERRQKILNIQKKEDSPSRFSDKEMNQSMAASVAISIDPDIIDKMQARFKSSLDSDGELDTSSSDKALKDILDADFKEVTDE